VLSYLVPEVEAEVKLNGAPIVVTRNALHEELVLRYRLLADVAIVVVGLALNEEMKKPLLHGGRSGWRRGRDKGLDARASNPKARVKAG
jgi:hypothetical protein